MKTDNIILREELEWVKDLEAAEALVSDSVDRYDLLRLDNDEIRHLPEADVKSILRYVTEYTDAADSDYSAHFLWYRGMADYGEAMAQVRFKELVKVLTAELNRK